MKIISRGNIFQFECKNCGCEFAVGKNEEGLKISSSYSTDDKKQASFKCPCCDSYCNIDNVKEIVMDGGYTRIIYQEAESQDKQES